MCQLYGMAGSLFGCASIWSMTLIAFDRYNVIVKGISAKPLTHGGAVLRVLFVWAASAVWTIAPLFGWNRYVPEGNMTACGTDYLTKDWQSRSYILVYGIWVYFVPLLLIIYSYWFILKAVSAHEKNMREQAKKMNVASLRSSENANQSAECKLAKVALMTISLWFMAWTPYLCELKYRQNLRNYFLTYFEILKNFSNQLCWNFWYVGTEPTLNHLGISFCKGKFKI